MKDAKHYLLMALLLPLITPSAVFAMSIESILDREEGAVFASYTPATGTISIMNLDGYESEVFTELQISSIGENLVTTNAPMLNLQSSRILNPYSFNWYWNSGIAKESLSPVINFHGIVEPNTPVADLALSVTQTSPDFYAGGFSTLRGFDFRGFGPVQVSHFGNIYVIPEPTTLTLALIVLAAFRFRWRR